MTKKCKKSGRFVKTLTLKDRFYKKVQLAKDNDCWLWKGFKYGNGYGRLRDENSISRQATHVSWYLKHGIWPTQLMCHKCDNPSCVNPDHLFEGTHKINALDMVKKRRHKFGEKNYNSILTSEDVKKIKSQITGKYGELTLIGEKYGVTYSTISKIKHNKQWKHVITN